MNDTPTLTGAGIVLRPLEIYDASALFVALSDPEVQFYRRLAPHHDVAETVRYIEETCARGYGWAITESGGEALGRLALRPRADWGEIGIVLRRAAQRRGLGSEAISLLQGFAFDTLRLPRLQAEIDPDNSASLLLFGKAGFRHRETMRVQSHRGRRDHLVMGQYNDDFRTPP